MKRWLITLTICAVAAQAEDARLLAGLAKVDITPAEMGGPMYGYRNRKCGTAAGVHDRLYAKVLVLQAGESRMAIVTMDLGSIAAQDVLRTAADELKIPLVFLSASHTHSAPAFLIDGKPTEYLAELERKVLGAIREASGAMFPARLAVGRGEIRLGYNRLLPRDDGRSRALFDNLERIPYGPVDPEFMLLRVDDAEGKARALLVQYAVHAVVLGPTSCQYSADYPGVLQARIETEMPGVQAMFVQGAAGETNPLFQGRTGNNEADFSTMTKMGEALSAEVLRSAKQMGRSEERPASILHRTSTMTFSRRWNTQQTLNVGVTTALINGQIAIGAVPGEPFLLLQRRWKAQAEAPYPFFFGYTQTTTEAWPGYIPDLRSAAHGGYGADVSTDIEVGAAERIVDRLLIQLYELKGMWSKEPGRP